MKNLFIDVDVNDFVIDSLVCLIENQKDALSIYSRGECYNDLKEKLFGGDSGPMLIDLPSNNNINIQINLCISDKIQYSAIIFDKTHKTAIISGIVVHEESTDFINSEALINYTKNKSCLVS